MGSSDALFLSHSHVWNEHKEPKSKIRLLQVLTLECVNKHMPSRWGVPWWPDRCSLWVGLAGPVEHQMALGMIGCSLSFDMTCFSDFGLFGLFGFYKHYQLIIICWNICSEISKISVCWLSVAFYRRSSCTSNWRFFPFGMLSSGWILTGSRLNPCWCLLVKSVLVFFES